MASLTNLQVGVRRADTWPRHVAKARERKGTRKHEARKAQQAIDAAANKKQY